MNRNELVSKIQVLVNKAYLEGIPEDYYKGIFKEVEKLRQPLTLADFLGWEEGIEYIYRNHKYKVCEGVLLIYNKNANRWYEAFERIKDYSRLQGAKKVKE